MNFDVCGPFELTRFTKKNLITGETLKKFKKDLEKLLPGIDKSCGCYIFCLRNNKNSVKPWYVGQANKSYLIDESLNPSNQTKYNIIMSENKGTPILYLLPQLTKKLNYYARPTKKKDGKKSINFLEDWLIGSAVQVNPNLINVKKTKMLRELHVTGLFNAKHGESSRSSRFLKTTLKLK